MHLTRPPTLLTLLSTLLTCIHALPAPTEADSSPDSRLQLRELLESRYHYLSGRSCANPCGWSGQVCCSSSQTCSTNSAGQAVCSGSAPQQEADVQGSGGQWQYFTTTVYVESDIATYTSTYSSLAAGASPAAAAISSISCNSGLGESPCGSLCCATGQYCLYAGQCAASSNNLLEQVSSSIQVSAPTPTPPASEPLRPTVNAATTVTSTGSATATVPFMTPSAGGASASGTALPGVNAVSNNGLSAGAIAGIVIGVLAGLFFLFIICAILCCKGLIDGILDFFGLRSRRRKETYIEEEHRHQGRTWYGRRRPVDDTVVIDKRKSSRWGSVAGFAGALGVLAVVLGLRRKREERRRSEKAASRYSESVSYDDYYSDTSPSSVSSDRRSRRTRQTRQTEKTEITRKSSRR